MSFDYACPMWHTSWGFIIVDISQQKPPPPGSDPITALYHHLELGKQSLQQRVHWVSEEVLWGSSLLTVVTCREAV